MRNITKTFGSVVANDKVSLDIYQGRDSGAAGRKRQRQNDADEHPVRHLLSRTPGISLVDGREVTIRSPKDVYDLGIGMVHQHFKLVDVLTAAENIILGMPGKGKLDLKAVGEKIRSISATVRL